MKPSFKTRAWCLLLTAVCAAITAEAQPAVVNFEHIGEEQGLSHLTVSAVYQDRSGFMWFGTIDGLNRFDGYRCLVFNHDPKNPRSLSSDFIHCITEDRAGRLWIGTRDGGLSMLPAEGREQGAFVRFLPDPGNPGSLSHAKVQTLFQDRAGRFWVGTAKGLDLFETQDRRFVSYRFFGENNADLTVTRIAEDAAGRLWVATDKGLYALDLSRFEKIDPNHGESRATHYTHNPQRAASLPTDQLNAVFCDRDNRIWVSSRGGGISLFRRDRDDFRHFRHDPYDSYSLSKGNPQIFFQDERGYLWIGSDGGGLNIMDPESGRFSRFVHQPSRSESISHNNVSHVYRSRDGERGSLWVATWGGGVNKLIEEDKPFRWIRHDPDDENSLSNNFVFSLLEDRDGDLWVGTGGGGLNRLERATGTWQRYMHDPQKPTSLSDNQIWVLMEDRSGTLWIGTEHGGLNRLERGENREPLGFRHFRHDPQTPDGLAENNIRSLYEDEEGTFWLGSEKNGLSSQTPVQRKTDSWTHYRPDPDNPHALSHGEVRCITQDRNGVLWIGTTRGGLNRLDPHDPRGEGFFAHFSKGRPGSLSCNDVRAVLETGDGRLWIGTYGGGLNLYRPESGSFDCFSLEQGLANAFIYGLLEDGSGKLWLSSNRGLSYFDPPSASFTHFTTQHGLQSDEFNTGAFSKSRSGEFFFGGVNGFNRFHPDLLLERLRQGSHIRPVVVLTGFAKMGTALPLGNIATTPVILDHTDKFFSFEWAVLDYRNPAKNRFRYRLEGFDEDWIENENRNYASYTNLDPGDYRLRYMGAGRNDVWNEGIPLKLRIEPPFWRTWWFRLFMVSGVLLAFLAGIKIRTYYHAYRGLKYVGHFEILDKLGEGGSGTVYRALDKISKRTIALKILNRRMEETPDGIRRFLQEAEIGARLNHPNIVKIHEAGNHGGTRYIAMEYLPGRTLKAQLTQEPPSPERVHELALQILNGLAAIHQLDIVHRDLKSANVMVLENGDVKIMDFGLARISYLTTMENRNQLMGTLAYMSPEQTLGKSVDRRSDLYAFGVLLYEMSFCRLPFSAENEMEMIYAIHNEPPPALNEKDPGSPLHKVIKKCMEKDPAYRYQTVEELRQALIGAGAKAMAPPGVKC